MVGLQQVMQLRHDYISCLKLAAETDSKKEEAYLKQEAHKALTELRRLCPHQHTVCTQSEYDGRWSSDDRCNPQGRICLCCGITESAYGNEFKILTTLPFKRFENNSPVQIRNSLSYLLTEVIEIAESTGYPYFGRSL